MYCLISDYYSFQKNTEYFSEIKNTVCISCYFGPSFSYVHPAPDSFLSYFFTNNESMKNEITKKGWYYYYVNEPQSQDILVSSIQAKKIKFLQCKEEFPFLFQGDDILYFDHKVYMKDEHVHYLRNISSNNPSSEIIIRKHENLSRKTIYDESNEASRYMERYKRHMPETLEYIKKYINEHHLTFETTICNTGVLYYHNLMNVSLLLDKIYKATIALQQPECQVLWAVFAQEYKPFITHINFSDVIALWRQASS
jgi:hypothetical protein